MLGLPGLSNRSVWNSAIGVPAGSDGSVTSIAAAVELVPVFPPDAALLNDDGAAAVSAAQAGLPASCGPPALIRNNAASSRRPSNGSKCKERGAQRDRRRAARTPRRSGLFMDDAA
jgi:hypothetical protein